MACDVLAGARLRCVVGDNAAEAGSGHSAGLNGLWSLCVREGDAWSDSVFTGGGLNLEHYFDRRNWRKGEAEWVDRMVYEPRHFPMSLSREGDALVLHQEATPFWGVESRTSFRLVEPDTVAMRCALTPRHRGFEGPDLAAFWASYLRQPADPGLWYGSSEGPRRHWHPEMGDRSTVCGPDEAVPADVPGSLWLFQNFAPERYVRPVMWGHWRQWLWGLMVRGEGRVRLALGPTGGGSGNPAWDFQFVVPNYQVDRTYTLEAALVLGQISPEDLLARYSAWAGA